jgi:DNA polymerase-3 subunit delta
MARQGFSFLVCADPELIKDRVAELLCHSEGFSPKTFWGDEDLPAGYWQALTVPVMMGPPSAVVLRRAQDQSEEFWSKIASALAMARTSIWPIFCLEGDWKAGKPSLPKHILKGKYWATAQAKGWIWEHPGLTRNTIGQELDRFAAKHGRILAPGVKKHLSEVLPLSTIALRNELDKILLRAGDATTITLAHLDALTREDPFDIFAFLRGLQNSAGRRAAWDRILNDPAMASGDMIFPISALLVREARQLWQLAQGEDSKVVLHPGVKAEKKKLAQRLGLPRISRFWDLALKADTDIKTGRVKPAQAMENLIRDVQRLW